MTNIKQPSKKNKQNQKGGGKSPLVVHYTARELAAALDTGEHQIIKAVKEGKPAPVKALDSLPNRHREVGEMLKRRTQKARVAHNRRN